jgi:hypothetical protein
MVVLRAGCALDAHWCAEGLCFEVLFKPARCNLTLGRDGDFGEAGGCEVGSVLGRSRLEEPWRGVEKAKLTLAAWEEEIGDERAEEGDRGGLHDCSRN